MKLTFNLIVDTTTGEFDVVNTETGEVKSVKVKKTSKTKTSKVEDTDPNPKLTLLGAKYELNTAALKALNVQPDDRIDIKYDKQGTLFIPIIGSDESFNTKGGNRLSKSNTVVYRGKSHDQLVEYGTVFDLIPCDNRPGIFILKGDKEPEIIEDENLAKPEVIDEFTDDLDIDDLVEDTTEISSLDFSL